MKRAAFGSGRGPRARTLSASRAEAAAQPAVPVAEREAEEGTQQGGGQRQARDEADVVGDQAGPLAERLDAAVVVPGALAEHRGALSEGEAGSDLLDADVVPVEREEAAEQQPAAAEPPRRAHVGEAEVVAAAGRAGH